MSDHCRFIVIPGGGFPARIVDSHPRPDVISDAIGGAIAVPLLLTHSAAMWVRESCTREGFGRNVVAALLAQCISGETLPLLGPCALTSIVFNGRSPDGRLSGVAEGLMRSADGQPDAADRLMAVIADLERAMAGHDDGFSTGDITAGWAERVRANAERCRQEPIPAGWPYEDAVRAEQARDPRWLGLARSFGDGRTYVPLDVH